MAAAIQIVEVGPRDGLQNEHENVPSELKVAFVEALAAAGLPVVEVTSFVRADRIPQLADAAEVFTRVKKRAGVRYPVLVPNQTGLARALAAGATEIALFTAASETFNRKNTNAGIAESLARFRELLAHGGATWVRAYVSTCFGCPYEGAVAPGKVHEVARALLELGVHELSIGDTIGVATPNQVDDVIGPLLAELGPERVAVHFHDTRGTALANVLRAVQLGVRIVDSSAGGLGGCPYAPGAAGNVATEDVVYMLEGMGHATGVDLDRVCAASEQLGRALGHPLPSRYLRAWQARRELA